MNRRTFMQSALPFAIAGVAFAQKAAKPDRLSGIVKTVDKSKMSIEMRGRKSANQIRQIMYDAESKFTLNGKPASVDDAKEGYEIVALGKFQGINLKANTIALTAK